MTILVAGVSRMAKSAQACSCMGQSFDVEQEKPLSGEQAPGKIAHAVLASQNA